MHKKGASGFFPPTPNIVEPFFIFVVVVPIVFFIESTTGRVASIFVLVASEIPLLHLFLH